VCQHAAYLLDPTAGPGEPLLGFEPISRRVAQARGAYNRACDERELALVRRWLASLATSPAPAAART
jgi:hypothetical protein